MLSKSRAISLLSKDFEKNLCLIEVLKHDDKAKLNYLADGAVALTNCDGIALVSVVNAEERKSAVDSLNNVSVAMACDEETAKLIQTKFSIEGFKHCYQAFWNKSQKIEENPLITIDKLNATDYNIKAILDNYRLKMSYDEVVTAITKRTMFGAYFDGSLAGFIGFHSELSMGMLEVFPPYRRMGIGSALLSRDINYCLDLGRLPFCHIVYGNDRSKLMCQKAGLSFYDGFVWWVG